MLQEWALQQCVGDQLARWLHGSQLLCCWRWLPGVEWVGEDWGLGSQGAVGEGVEGAALLQILQELGEELVGVCLVTDHWVQADAEERVGKLGVGEEHPKSDPLRCLPKPRCGLARWVVLDWLPASSPGAEASLVAWGPQAALQRSWICDAHSHLAWTLGATIGL